MGSPGLTGYNLAKLKYKNLFPFRCAPFNDSKTSVKSCNLDSESGGVFGVSIPELYSVIFFIHETITPIRLDLPVFLFLDTGSDHVEPFFL